MKLQVCVFSLGIALVAACSGGSGTPSSVSDDTVGGSCHSKSECTGALPRNEVSCSDGTFSGASWECKSEACTLIYCEGHGGTGSSSSPNCATAKFQACNMPSDCHGHLPSGKAWFCTNDTPLAACNFAEPVCVIVKGPEAGSSGDADGGDDSSIESDGGTSDGGNSPQDEDGGAGDDGGAVGDDGGADGA